MSDPSTRRVLTYPAGSVVKPYTVPSYNSSTSQYWGYEWFKPVRHNSYIYGGKNGGNQIMTGGHKYWITDHNGGKHGVKWGDQGLSKHLHAHGSRSSGERENEGSKEVQGSGICFRYDSYKNEKWGNDSNGFAFEVLTDKDDPFKGASPMPVIGVNFKLWCCGNTNFAWGSDSIGNGSREASCDHGINRMHLIYKQLDGATYSRAILPEGINGGDYAFFDKDRMGSTDAPYEKKKLDKNRGAQTGRFIRAWHTEDIEENSFLIGFSCHIFCGRVANVNKFHNMFFGSMTPILKGDLSVMRSGDKNKHKQIHCMQPPCKDETDARAIVDRKPSIKLQTFNDPDRVNDTMSGYKKNSSLKIGQPYTQDKYGHDPWSALGQ